MINSSIMQGLQILYKYVSPGGYEFITPEHDQIYAGPSVYEDENPVSQEDGDELNNLGWFVDDDACRWSAYT